MIAVIAAAVIGMAGVLAMTFFSAKALVALAADEGCCLVFVACSLLAAGARADHE